MPHAGYNMKKGHIISLVLGICIAGITGADSRPMIEDISVGTVEQKISAMYYFGFSKNKASFWYMVKNLDKTYESDDLSYQGERIRKAAAESLGRLGDERAVPFLIKRFNGETREAVKISIIASLGAYKDKDILPVLKAGLESDSKEMVMEALQSAASYGDTGLVAQIKNIADKSTDDGLRLFSAYALIMLKDEPEKNAGYLRKGLSNPDPTIRFWSAGCLSLIDRIDAIEDLLKALEIENQHWVRKEIEYAVVMLALKRRDSLE